ncbi:MAG: uncharacterized protein HW380_4012 [Magnetococcales bacterium]|nr:uncharacterized protein [Magnetococcales bacterium]HIJ85883.1 CBS domain-containing protein [Magnetococcales bacterium]
MKCIVAPLVEQHFPTIEANSTVQACVDKLVSVNRGSLVVMDKGKLAGFFSERDLLLRVVGKELDPKTTYIRDVMTTNLLTAEHDDTCQKCIDKMRKHRIRHLMVHENGSFIGTVSISKIAGFMGKKTTTKDIAINIAGGVVLLLVVIVISIMAYLIPDMIQMTNRNS